MTRRPAPKGWCPSSLRPMESGDGYIVRIKPAFGRVTRMQLEKIAHLADRFGNGIIELTNRANLQLRGVSMADHPALIDALVQAELVDMDPDLDAAPQILVAPNCDADMRNLYDNLRRAKLPNLPAKFGMVLEQGGQMLMQASGDIRLCALGDQVVVWADGCDGGVCLPFSDAVGHVEKLATWFAQHCDADHRRMSQVLKVAQFPAEWCVDPLPEETKASSGAKYAVPFGQMTSAALLSFTEHAGSDDIRLTPWRQFCVAGVQKTHDIQGFVTDLSAPVLRAQACTGAPRCPQAMGETHALAARLAPQTVSDLHVSGCPKGCAKRTKTPVTVVQGANGLDLIINGCTWDQPDFSGLDEGQLVQKIREINATHL